MDVTTTLNTLRLAQSVTEKEELRTELAAYLNYLLVNDFAALVQLLYRVDVSEQKLKTVLTGNKQADAGDLIAELLLERQQQKQAQKTDAVPPDQEMNTEEAW